MERKIITGIYGGSFNPIHRGHVCLAKALAETEFVDEIWLLVSPQNPFKVDDCLLDDALRLRLTRMAVAHEPKVEVCDREFTLPKPSYMYNTLTALSQEHSDREFVLVIGADNWERFHRWYRSDDILRETPIIVYPRGEDSQIVNHNPSSPLATSGSEQHLDIQVLDFPLLPYSSTEIRTLLAAGEDADYMLHPTVAQYIRQHNLYKQ